MRFFLLLALLLSGFAFAGGAPPSSAEAVDVRRLPYTQLFEAQSEGGESLDTFMARIAPRLRAWSDETTLEACAAIATDGERYAVIVGTSQSHLGCAIYSAKVPAGFRFTGESIHSHGGKARFKMNRADRIFAGVPEDVRSQSQRGTVYGQDLEKFSEIDLGGTAGYLATPSGVIYQDGAGHIRTIHL